MKKNRTFNELTFAALVVVFLTSCRKEPNPMPAPLAVIESYLTPGKPITVHITREILYGSADTLSNISGLQVRISHDGQTEVLTETGPGRYELLNANVLAGGNYLLSFSYQGKDVSAETTVPLDPSSVTASATQIVVPQIGPGMIIPDPIIFTWQNPEQAYHLMVIKNMEANPQPITFNLGNDVIEKPAPVFRISPMKGSQQQLSLGKFSYYGRHAVLLYRIQPEYAALYEDSGNSSASITTAATNVKNGLGVFTGVNPADTLWVTVR